MAYVTRLDKPGKVRLRDINPDDTGGLKRDDGDKLFAPLDNELGALQEQLYAAHIDSVLIVLQGMDTSGKDGTIRHVMASVNPQGCQVSSFKIPSADEAAHDFLWRIHHQTPAKGMIGIFNRSHYEDVLVVRVHNLVEKKTWLARYDDINNFERMLTENGTLVLKFFLYISKEEQKERLLAREADVEKAWKLSAGDWKERMYWDDYTAAYEDMLSKCSTEYAPWHIVPANKKWFRNVAIADMIVKVLRPRKKVWSAELERIAATARADLAILRTAGGAQ